MPTFTIDADNTITAYTTAQAASQAGAGPAQFNSQDELAELAAKWPLSRFVEIWNGIPGNTTVHKFQDRKKALARVWKALQPLAALRQVDQLERGSESVNSNGPAQSRKHGNKIPAQPRPSPAKLADQSGSARTNKKARVIALLQRAKGVTLAEVVATTGWQRHTVRGFVSILGSQGGHTIESSTNAAGERTYKIVS